MASYGLLGQQDEDSLHKLRLLNVEEKPFKRISKRLLSPGSLVLSQITNSSFSLDITDNGSTAAEEEKHRRLSEWRNFRDDVALDFAAFEASIARIQFLLTSNGRERERYMAEKTRILNTMQAVRENTAELRDQLEEAQRLLALRKSYDDLAEKITSNRLLRPREDQQASLQKLQAEITELENESKEYAKTWSERRDQFGRIVEEGMQLRRLIRDEKEEVERREGMQDGRDGDDGDIPSKGKLSEAGTPRRERDSMTPSQQSHDETSKPSLPQPEKRSTGSRAGTPLRHMSTTDSTGEQGDTNMADDGEITGDNEGLEDLEEGEELPDNQIPDRMDTT